MDNLRYISLQYIKGDNYEKIQCFKYEEIMELLVYIKESRDYSVEILSELKRMKEKDKCLVGESFLNDLVSYYNFTDIREKIDDITGGNIVIDKKRDELIKKLDDLTEIIKSSNSTPRLIIVGQNIESKFKEFVKLYNGFVVDSNKFDVTVVITMANNNPANPVDATDSVPAKGAETALTIFYDYLLDDNKYGGIKTDAGLYFRIKDTFYDIIKYSDGTKDHLMILLNVLKEVLKFEEEKNNVLLLFKIYRKICSDNIAKFDKLFTKTDISSIDDAFMIKPYAVFLDKFKKIKKSLEGKDLTKLERGLSNSLERLFYLYGINDPDTLLQNDKSKYLLEYIASK